MSSILRAKQKSLLKSNGIKQTEQEHLQANQSPFSTSRQKLNLHASQMLPGRDFKYTNIKAEDSFYQKSQGYSQDCVQCQSSKIPNNQQYRQRSFLTIGMKKKFNMQDFQKVNDKNSYKNQQFQQDKGNSSRVRSSQKSRMYTNRSVLSNSPQPVKKVKAYSPSPQFAKTQRNQSKPHLISYKNDPSEKDDDFSVFSGTIYAKKQRRKTILGPGTCDFENGPQRDNPFQSQIINIQNSTKNSIGLMKIKASQLNLANLQSNEVSFTQKQTSQIQRFPENFDRKTVHQLDKVNLLVFLPPSRRCNSPCKPKECDNQFIQKQIIEQKQKNHAFYDDIFPPRQSIIFTRRIFYQQQGLSFERLTKIYENKRIGILQFSQPSFLEQGKFTSPAVFSALAILSEQPMRVANIFGNQHFNSYGIYFIQICKEGVWRNILIDDFMPIKNTQYGQKKLLFLNSVGKNNTHQIWPCLIQKGLAKVYGSYQDLRKTTKTDGVKGLLKMLTGFPCSHHQLNKDFRSYLIIIDSAMKKNHIVVLQKIQPSLQETAKIQNIDPSYSYQIIQVKKDYITIRNFAQEGLITKLNFEEVLIFQQLLIFRNQNSKNYTVKAQRNRQMSTISKQPSKSNIDIRSYELDNVNNNLKSYIYWSYSLRHKQRYYSILKICLLEDSRCYFDIWQSNPANFNKNLLIKQPEKYSTSPYQIKIIGLGESQEINFQSNQSLGDSYLISEKDSGKQIELRKGNYLLQIHLCQKFERDFTLSYYGRGEIDCKKSIRLKNTGKLWEGVSSQGGNSQLNCICRFNESKQQ